MFSAISKFFKIIEEIFTAVHILAHTGTEMARQYEAEAQLGLSKKRKELQDQEKLFLATATAE